MIDDDYRHRGSGRLLSESQVFGRAVKSTRSELVDRLSSRWGCSKRVAAAHIDDILDVVSDGIVPIISKEWSGNKVVCKLDTWRGKK